MPKEFEGPEEVVDWVGENLAERGWEPVKEELDELGGYESLVSWLDAESEEARLELVATPAAREQLVAWLAGAAIMPEVGENESEASPASVGSADAANASQQMWDEARGEWLTYDAERGWLEPDGHALSEPAESATATATEEPAAETVTSGSNERIWDEARGEWLTYDAERGWLEPDGHALSEPTQPAPDGNALSEPTEPEPATAPAEPELAELGESTQAMVDSAVDDEIAPVFDEAFSSIEGIEDLSPEELREALAEALAEAGLSE